VDSVNESFGVDVFYGMVESNHLSIIVDFWSSRQSSDRLEMSEHATLTNIFVGMLMLSMLGIYGGMFYYVRRAARKSKWNQENFKNLRTRKRKRREELRKKQ
jgi:hypothetical protein